MIEKALLMKPSNEDLDDAQMVEASYIIYQAETLIDPSRDLYLMTFNPNPAELPNCDFQLQHSFAAQWLIDYLKSCYSGCFCVESTQLGSPHYHGWYQLANDPKLDTLRIVYMKSLQRYGMVKVTKCKYSYVINSYSKRKNALYYYKKDLCNSTMYYKYNPITEDTVIDINWDEYQYRSFFALQAKKDVPVDDIISAYKFTVQFYANSL